MNAVIYFLAFFYSHYLWGEWWKEEKLPVIRSWWVNSDNTRLKARPNYNLKNRQTGKFWIQEVLPVNKITLRMTIFVIFLFPWKSDLLSIWSKFIRVTCWFVFHIFMEADGHSKHKLLIFSWLLKIRTLNYFNIFVRSTQNITKSFTYSCSRQLM